VKSDPTKPPAALLSAVARDLRPVKASPTPLQSALRAVPLAFIVSSLILLPTGLRRDSQTLGPLLTWGASAMQFGLALVLVWIAARESNPAKRLPKDAVYLGTIAILLVVASVTLLTFWTSPTTVSPRVTPLRMGIACGAGSVIAGAILVGVLAGMFRKSLTTRPAVAGALFGAGAGVSINAGWRLACPVSEPWHAFGAHGTALIATIVLGALVGKVLAGRGKSFPSKHGEQ
jgi:hypothetical protein